MKRSDRQKQVYESWVAQHAADLYRMAYRLSGAAASAEDLVQETFYQAWKSMGSLKDPGKARAWLFQILRFRYAHWVRGEVRRPRGRPLSDVPDDTLAVGEDRSPLDVMIDQELLQKAMDDLSDLFKIPFLMVTLQGLTCRETAQALDLPLGTVLSRIHRARQMLRKQLRDAETTPHDTMKDTTKSLDIRIPGTPDRSLRLRG